MKMQLTHSKSSSKRYYLISGSMSNAGEPKNHANHYYEIVNGVDRGNGYQGYMSVSYFLTLEHIPKTAKDLVKHFIKSKNLTV